MVNDKGGAILLLTNLLRKREAIKHDKGRKLVWF